MERESREVAALPLGGSVRDGGGRRDGEGGDVWQAPACHTAIEKRRRRVKREAGRQVITEILISACLACYQSAPGARAQRIKSH